MQLTECDATDGGCIGHAQAKGRCNLVGVLPVPGCPAPIGNDTLTPSLVLGYSASCDLAGSLGDNLVSDAGL